MYIMALYMSFVYLLILETQQRVLVSVLAKRFWVTDGVQGEHSALNPAPPVVCQEEEEVAGVPSRKACFD